MTVTVTGDIEPGGDLVDLVERARAVRAEVAAALAASNEADLENDHRDLVPDGSIQREQARDLAFRILDREAAAILSSGGEPLAVEIEERIVELVLAMLFGLGVLQRFIDDPSVENIDVNGAETAWVTYSDGRKVRVGPVAASDEELVAMVRSGAARFGLSERRFDAAQPELDLRLPDGSRLSAVMAVTEHPIIDIRRHRLADLTLQTLVELEMVGADLGAFLIAAVRAKRNLLVSGAMNSGKTTLLRALAAEVSPRERIVTIEQALELGLDRQVDRHPDCVAMEARLANTEGVGEITMATLVRRSLRMNASRVIVGEVLGDEVIPMLNAMSQGRSGSMGTVHADSSAGVFRRLASYAVQAPERLPLEATNLLIAGAVHFVVHLDSIDPDRHSLDVVDHLGHTGKLEQSQLSPDGTPASPRWRYVSSVREVVDAEGPLVISNEIWRPGPEGPAVPGAPIRDSTAELLAAEGYRPSVESPGRW